MEIIQDTHFIEKAKQKILLFTNFVSLQLMHIAATFALPVL